MSDLLEIPIGNILGIPATGMLTLDIESSDVQLMYFSQPSANYEICPKSIYNSFNVDKDHLKIAKFVKHILLTETSVDCGMEFYDCKLVPKSHIEENILFDVRKDKQVSVDDEVLLFTLYFTM